MKKYIIKEQAFIGSPIRVIGCFDFLEKAEEAKKKLEETRKILSIEEIDLNKEER